jgi:hypothetical protein
MEALLDQMYDPANSSFVLKLAIGVEDQMIHEVTTRMIMNLVLTSDMLDASLGVDEMTIVQDLISIIVLFDFDEPVMIEAPTLGE